MVTIRRPSPLRLIDSTRSIERSRDDLRAHYFEVTAISREVTDDKSLLASDGLHPSAKMYKRWAEAIAPIARCILSPDRSREP